MGNANWTFIIVKIMISVLLVVIIKMKDENDMGWKSDSFSFSTGWRLGKAFCSLLQMGDSRGQSQVVQGRVYKLELPQCLGTPQLPNPRRLIQFKIKKKKWEMLCLSKTDVSEKTSFIPACCFMDKNSTEVLSCQSLFLPLWWE